MRELIVLLVHSIVTLVRLTEPGGFRSVVAESVVLRQQLLILNRGRKRAPQLGPVDRIIVGLCALFIRPTRIFRSAIVLKPSTLLYFHYLLKRRKYRMLFSSKRRRRPGPKEPEKELIEAVVEMKRRNPNWGCPRIAQQIALAFGLGLDKDVVRRILCVHYRPESVRREYQDTILFWTTTDLEMKLVDFQHYFNAYRTHAGLEGRLPEPSIHESASAINLGSYRWRSHCRGLFQTPIAA